MSKYFISSLKIVLQSFPSSFQIKHLSNKSTFCFQMFLKIFENALTIFFVVITLYVVTLLVD